MVTTRNRSGAKNLEAPESKQTEDKTRGTKRKRKASSTDKGESLETTEPEPKMSRIKPEEAVQEVEAVATETPENGESVVCQCPRNIMTCIGILPSLPIMDRFCDSDDSESDPEDYTHTVLPIVDRSKKSEHAD